MRINVQPKTKDSSIAPPTQERTWPKLQTRPFTEESEAVQAFATPTPQSQSPQPNQQIQREKVARAGFNLANIPLYAPEQTSGTPAEQSGIQRQEVERKDDNLQMKSQAETPEQEEVKKEEVQTKPQAETPQQEEEVKKEDIQTKPQAETPQQEEEVKKEEVQTKLQAETPQQEEQVKKEDIQTKSEGSTHQQEEEVKKEEVQTKPQGQTSEQEQEVKKEEDIQTKLTIGKPGDKYEQEADHMAAKVMAMPDPAIQQTSQPQKEEEKAVQTKPLANSITPVVQRRTENEKEEVQMKPGQQKSALDGGNLESHLASQKSGGSPLPDDVRSFMEQRFGTDLSQVRVHTDAEAVKLNKELGAQAFTHGNHIYYGQGKSPAKDDLTAHELTHVIQQTGGSKAKSVTDQPKKGNKLQAKADLTVSPDIQPAIRLKENPHAEPVQKVRTASPTADSGQGEEPAQAKVTPTAKSGAAASPPPSGGAGASSGGNGKGSGAGASSGVTGQGTAGSATGKASGSAGGKSATSAQSDPGFQAVVNKAKGVAKQQKQHDPASKKSKQAQDAAVSPPKEMESKAQDKQVQEMQQQKPGEFNANAFKAALLDKIKAITPKTEEEAKQFKENNQIDSVRQDVSSQVTTEQKQAADPIEEKTKEKPDTKGIEPKPVTPLARTAAGSAPADIGAAQATPKPKSESEVSRPLQSNSKELDQQMAAADVTDKQLAKSNEPQFLGALDAKKKAQTNTEKAPAAYRSKEQAVLTQAKADAQTTGQQQIQGMHGQREGMLAQVMGLQGETKGKDEQERSKVATDIDGIYENTKNQVEGVLKDIDTQVTSKFDAGAGVAKQKFENYVDQKMSAYKEKRYGSAWDVTKWGNRVNDFFNGLPPEVNQFFDDGRQLYISDMDVTLTGIAQFVAQKLNQAKQKITEGKQKIKEYVASLPSSLKQVGQEASQNIQGKFDQLEESVNNKQNELIDTLAQKYSENLKTIDARIEQMKEENKGLFDKVKDKVAGVIKTINELKNMLMGVLRRAGGAIGKIIQDPIGFLGNLIAGLKQGFLNFKGNIGQHLKQGFMGFLTGAMASTGIQMPESFDIKGIFSLVTQVLGMTYETIRPKAVKRMGEKQVSALESNFEMFVILKNEGTGGLWKFIQGQIGDLKSMVVDTIQSFIIEKVIVSGITWILSLLNPASAFVRACKAIIDIIMFFIERASQIAELINAVIDAVIAIASGSIGGAAKAIENALSKSLPVVISFMASLLGIGGISDKVQEVIKRVRQPIEKAINWVIEQAVKFAKKISGKLGFGKDKEKSKDGKENKSESEKKHAEMGNAAAKELSQKPDKEMPYEELRPAKEKKAQELEAKYNKQLENPVKMTISFQSPEKDKKDGDMDFHIHIGPNDFDMDGAVEGVANGVPPEVGTYGALKSTSGKNDQEAHHVPPKGLLGWIVSQAVEAGKKMTIVERQQYPWLEKLASISPEISDPGNPLAAISINKHTHIKKTGNPNKDAFRAHWGTGTAKEVLKRLDGKGLRLIYRTKFNQLSPEDKTKYRKLLLEAGENPNSITTGDNNKSEQQEVSALSTQFFSTELNAALEEEQKEKGTEIEKFKDSLSNVAKGAYLQAHEAVTVALENSDRDGPKEKRQDALNQIKGLSKTTWESAGVDLDMF